MGTRLHAPEFRGALAWINVERPLTLADLRGKVVLLDFWTFCCINCMHVIPDLKRLEAKYGNKLAVIGVHSAKFENEKDTENIRQAVLRYEIEHPVINDANFQVWQAYSVRAWPTLVLIDPEGYVVGSTSGEGNYDILDQAIATELEKHATLINEKPLPLSLEKDKVRYSALSFPGKVIHDPEGHRLFISDTNHNRVVSTTLEGKVLEIIGSGKIGAADSQFSEASFHHPQGLALKGEILYVADTENHLIRAVDLLKKQVRTIAGTGVQSEDRRGGNLGTEQGLNSPWDLALHENFLYIAMAGPHQIWRMDLRTSKVEAVFGSGREDILDGPAARAALAQPSGLAVGKNQIFFADSEVSAIRSATLSESPEVNTIIGHGLFDFGDIDGPTSQARLQHPLGVAFNEAGLFIADTYNHKIKRIDLGTKTIQSLSGTGKAGFLDGSLEQAQFSEPGGLSINDNKIYVADTNNHAIRLIDLGAKTVSTLQLQFPETQSQTTATSSRSPFLPNLSEVSLPEVSRGSSTTLAIELKIQLPAGYHLNPDAPSTFQAEIAEEVSIDGQVKATHSAFQLSLPHSEGLHTATFKTTIYYCTDSKTGVCKIKSFRFIQPLRLSKTSKETGPIEIIGIVPH